MLAPGEVARGDSKPLPTSIEPCGVAEPLSVAKVISVELGERWLDGTDWLLCSEWWWWWFWYKSGLIEVGDGEEEEEAHEDEGLW